MSDFWKGKKVLITGPTGLVGSFLTSALLYKGADIVTFVRDLDPQSELIKTGLINETRVVQGSLEDYFSIERAINEYEIDTVFHLGAQTIVDVALRSPLPTFESNVRGTYHLLEACRQHTDLVKRILIASSDKAYGTSPLLPYSEEMPLQGKHPYDVSKACADLIAHSYFHSYGLPVVIARCGNIYGGGDLNWSRLIPGTIKSLLEDKTPLIRSDGTFQRDYLFVKDAVDAYLLLGKEASREDISGEAFNFAPNRPYTVLEVITEIQEVMQKSDLSFQILNRAQKEIQNQFLSSKKAERLLGWRAKYSLREGILETIPWYQQHFANK